MLSGNSGACMGLHKALCLHAVVSIAGCSHGSNSGREGVSESLMLWGPLASYWVASSNLDMRVCAWSLLYPVMLLCLADITGRPVLF